MTGIPTGSTARPIGNLSTRVRKILQEEGIVSDRAASKLALLQNTPGSRERTHEELASRNAFTTFENLISSVEQRGLLDDFLDYLWSSTDGTLPSGQLWGLFSSATSDSEGADARDSIDFYFLNNAPDGDGTPDTPGLRDALAVPSDLRDSNIEDTDLSYIVLKSHMFDIGNMNADALSVWLRGVPATDLARATPFLRVSIIQSDRSTLDVEGGRHATLSWEFSLSGRSAYALSNDLAVSHRTSDEVASIFDRSIKDYRGTAYQKNDKSHHTLPDVFNAPQTYRPFGPERADVLNPSVPQLGLTNFSVRTDPTGYGLIANRTADLSLVLFDRSRMRDIAPLISPRYRSEVAFEIEWGWSCDISEAMHNPYTKLLNDLRVKEYYSLIAPNFSFNDDGSVNIDLKLNLRPHILLENATLVDGVMEAGPVRNIEATVREVAEKISAITQDSGDPRDLAVSLGGIRFLGRLSTVDDILNIQEHDEIIQDIRDFIDITIGDEGVRRRARRALGSETAVIPDGNPSSALMELAESLRELFGDYTDDVRRVRYSTGVSQGSGRRGAGVGGGERRGTPYYDPEDFARGENSAYPNIRNIVLRAEAGTVDSIVHKMREGVILPAHWIVSHEGAYQIMQEARFSIRTGAHRAFDNTSVMVVLAQDTFLGTDKPGKIAEMRSRGMYVSEVTEPLYVGGQRDGSPRDPSPSTVLSLDPFLIRNLHTLLNYLKRVNYMPLLTGIAPFGGGATIHRPAIFSPSRGPLERSIGEIGTYSNSQLEDIVNNNNGYILALNQIVDEDQNSRPSGISYWWESIFRHYDNGSIRSTVTKDEVGTRDLGVQGGIFSLRGERFLVDDRINEEVAADIIATQIRIRETAGERREEWREELERLKIVDPPASMPLAGAEALDDENPHTTALQRLIWHKMERLAREDRQVVAAAAVSYGSVMGYLISPEGKEHRKRLWRAAAAAALQELQEQEEADGGLVVGSTYGGSAEAGQILVHASSLRRLQTSRVIGAWFREGGIAQNVLDAYFDRRASIHPLTSDAEHAGELSLDNVPLRTKYDRELVRAGEFENVTWANLDEVVRDRGGGPGGGGTSRSDARAARAAAEERRREITTLRGHLGQYKAAVAAQVRTRIAELYTPRPDVSPPDSQDPWLSDFIKTHEAGRVNPFSAEHLGGRPFYNNAASRGSRDDGKVWCSLGRVFGFFFCLPLKELSDGDYSEMQFLWHCFNSNAGWYANQPITNFLIEKAELQRVLTRLFTTSGIRVTVSAFINAINSEIIRNPASASYGFDRFYVDVAESETRRGNDRPMLDGYRQNNSLYVRDYNALLKRSYKRFGGDTEPAPQFSTPNLSIQVFSLPELDSGTERARVVGDEPPKPIARFHIHDRVSSRWKSLATILQAVRVTDPNLPSEAEILRSTYQDPALQSLVANIIDDGTDIDYDRTSKIYSFRGGLARIKKLYRRIMPSFRYAGEGSAISKAKFSSYDSSQIATIQILRNFSGTGLTPAQHQGSGLPFRVEPTKVSVEMLGFPFVGYAQYIFADFDTNTTADNIYAVNSINNTISPGVFTTTLELIPPADAYSRLEGPLQVLTRINSLPVAETTATTGDDDDDS